MERPKFNHGRELQDYNKGVEVQRLHEQRLKRKHKKVYVAVPNRKP